MTKAQFLKLVSYKGKGKYFVIFEEFKEIVLATTPIELINYLKYHYDLTDEESKILPYNGLRVAQMKFKKNPLNTAAKKEPALKENDTPAPLWEFKNATDSANQKKKFFNH